MKIYTRLGDLGKTSLLDDRVSKNNIRIETNGQIDELLVNLAFLIEEVKKLRDEYILDSLFRVYKYLFIIQSAIADTKNNFHFEIKESDVNKLEEDIDLMDETLPKLKHFISYTGSNAGMWCQLVRAKVRTVERLAVTIYENEELNPMILKYLNRLSDYLFTLARFINLKSGIEEELLIL